ncbi:MAG: hypothetical protein ACI8XU_000546 [Kiritimatiellia bacterium]|jgi:uncharacterized protein (DUF1330 family)
MISIVALLTVRDADAFDQFERQAAVIMKAYGGRIDSAFRPGATDSKAAQSVDEIHVLKFPDQEAFDRYTSDDKLLALAPLREKAISQSSVYVSVTEVDYAKQE